MTKSLIRYILGLFLFTQVIYASQPGEKTVTYSDFSYILDIASSNNVVYFATSRGILRFDKIDNEWKEPINDYSHFDYNTLTNIWVDQFDNNLYAYTGDNYYEYDMLLEQWFPIGELPSFTRNYSTVNPPRVMYPPDGYNYLSEGYLVDPDGRDYEMNEIIDDHAGSWWISFWGFGAAMSSTSNNMITVLPFGLLQNRVDAIYNDGGILWLSGLTLGQYRTGITKFDPDNNSFRYLESGVIIDFPQADVYCFDADKELLYVGTSYGLISFNKKTNRIINRFTKRNGLPDDYVYAVKSVGDTLFVGTDNGISIFKKKSGKFSVVRPGEFVNVRIYDFVTTDSSIWIATSQGAYQLHFNDGKLEKFIDPHNVVFSQVFNLDRFENELWFATDNGLLKLNLKNGETTPFLSINPSAYYRALTVNDEIAAYSTNRGFTIIFNHRKEHPNIKEYSTEDGLPSTRVRSLLLDGDFLWIGTDKGLTRFWWSNPYRVD